ncbi:Cytidylate kinase [Coemansia reversa NRRL 1564]|uniref:(d)CMP kinase n=1 Tax=Coemansia reversa (strain ATCC 12441 / NRRL 1564) TaxID=763665 RepID=A0A2G5B7J5_COERN|nr:Cytidylate kinase [Coemansia reversa NRRL 1564]|eukprot:PIA14988.1 Cytidylate kinase [Coemansia reversa NRRL 1564]
MLCSRVGYLCRAPTVAARCLQARSFTIAIDGPAASGKSSTARAVAQQLGFGYIDSGSIYRCATLLALRKNIYAADASAEGDEQSQKLVDLISRANIDINIKPGSGWSAQSAAGTGRLVVPDVQVLLDGEDVSREIRAPEINRLVAKVASDGGVRDAVLHTQRYLAYAAETRPASTPEGRGTDSSGTPGGGVVMDGRDIGTTVFPKAELKIYLDASAMARAIRRWDEMNSHMKETQAAAAAAAQKSNADRDAVKKDGDQASHASVSYPSVEDIARELEQRDYADINRKHSPLRIASDAVVIDNTNMTFEHQVYSIVDLARERMGLPRRYDEL